MYEICKKRQRYQTCKNYSKRELFSIGANLSYNNIFSENLLALEIEKIEIFMNKPVYLRLRSISNKNN